MNIGIDTVCALTRRQRTSHCLPVYICFVRLYETKINSYASKKESKESGKETG
jgi:hypothetical protein